MEEDESDTSSGSEMGVMVTCESEGQHSSTQLTSEENTKDEDDQTSGDGGNAGNLTKEHPTLPWRSTRQKQAPPPCHIFYHKIRGVCSENCHLPQRKHQCICSACKIYFLYFHTSSHVKPWRVKMCMQMRAGRKGHKKEWMWISNDEFLALLLWQSFNLDKNWLEEKWSSV